MIDATPRHYGVYARSVAYAHAAIARRRRYMYAGTRADMAEQRVRTCAALIRCCCCFAPAIMLPMPPIRVDVMPMYAALRR